MTRATRKRWTKSQLKELAIVAKEDEYTREGQAQLYIDRTGTDRPIGGVKAKLLEIVAKSKSSKAPAAKTTQRGPAPVSNVTLTARVGELTISGPSEAVISYLQKGGKSGDTIEFTVALN